MKYVKSNNDPMLKITVPKYNDKVYCLLIRTILQL